MTNAEKDAIRQRVAATRKAGSIGYASRSIVDIEQLLAALEASEQLVKVLEAEAKHILALRAAAFDLSHD